MYVYICLYFGNTTFVAVLELFHSSVSTCKCVHPCVLFKCVYMHLFD